MEDIIFILIAVVWLMYSLFKGKSKKKQPAKPTPQPGEQPRTEKKDKDFETVFREILGEEEETDETETDTEEEYTRSEPTPHETYAKKEETKEYEQHTGMIGVSDDFEFSAEGEIETLEDQLAKQQQKKDKHLEVIDLWDEDEDLESFQFDPRNAIIYSEIIKRKY